MTPEQTAALDAMMKAEQPRLQRSAEKVKAKRKREEEMFQRATKQYLDFNFTQEILPHWAVRNETPPPPDGTDPHEWAMRQGKRAKDMGILAGVCDWHFLLHGKYRVIELKVTGGSVSTAQKTYMGTIKRHGGEAYVAWSMDEFHAIISSWLPVRYDPPACNLRSKRQMTQQVAQKEMYKNDELS